MDGAVIGTMLRAIRSRAGSLATGTLDFVLPPRCPGCGDMVDRQGTFCGRCWMGIRFLGDPCCVRCGTPFAYDLGAEAQCPSCIANPPPFGRARAVMAYGDVARSIALRLKYGRRTGLARLIAHHMARHVPAEASAWLLVPVPLHRWRLWSRGFNQSALIASALARISGAMALNDALIRTRATPPLRGMSRGMRARTVTGAFMVAPSRAATINGAHICLIDDIWTTGATASACARALRRAGAAQVDLLCWARVLDDDGDDFDKLAD